MLEAYCQTFITGEENASYNIRMLLKFFKSRGKLHELLTRIYTKEIETTSVHNPLFRGNTLFTKIYNEYTKTYCKEYFNKIMQPIVALLEQFKSQEEQPSEDVIYAKTLELFTDLLKKYPPPSTLMICLHGLYRKVIIDRSETIACNVIQTLLFLRFLLTSLSHHGTILRKLQMLMKKSGQLLNASQVKRLTPQETEFIRVVNITYSMIFNCPYGEQTVFKGYDESEQEESFKGILNIIRTNMNKFYANYGEGFEEFFKITKNTKEQPKSNLFLVSEEMVSRMIEKYTELEEENKRLKQVISATSDKCEFLRKKIEKIEQFLHSSSTSTE